MKHKIRFVLSVSVFLSLCSGLFAQTNSLYQFTDQGKVKLTELKPASVHSECWILSTSEFLEAEIENSGKGTAGISDLVLLYNLFQWKAEKYFEAKGNLAFGPRGKPSDIISLINKYGFLPPEGFYPAPPNMEQFPGEMIATLKGTLSIVMTKNNGNFDQRWQDQFNATIENYLGRPAADVMVDDQKFTADQYAKKYLPEVRDYITLTCMPEEPLYQLVEIKENDNWSHSMCYNISAEDMVEVVKNSIRKNHPVLWNGIITKEMIYEKQNLALFPEKKIPADPTAPITERKFDNQMRSELFKIYSQGSDNYLIINGLAQSQGKIQFYNAVNCCASNKIIKSDYLILSETFLKAQTLSIMVNKVCLPEQISGKITF